MYSSRATLTNFYFLTWKKKMRQTAYNLITDVKHLFGIVVALSMTACSTPAQMLQSTASKPQYLYAVNAASRTISAYRINPSTGALTQVPGSPFATNDSLFITINPASTFAYTQDFFNGTISAFRINAATGALTPVPGSPFSTGFEASRIAINPAGTFAYVSSMSSHTISAYRIDASTGALNPIPRSPFSVALEKPSSVTIDPAGSFIYTNTGSIFSINASSGVLTPVRSRTLAHGNDISSITISPNGTFAYISAQKTISVYHVNAATGDLTSIPGSPFSQQAVPEISPSVTINAAGTVAYVADSNLNSYSGISTFSINLSNGALTEIPGSPFVVGTSMAPVVLSPAGTFIYQGGTGQSISALRIDPATGALTPISGSPFPAGHNPDSIAVARP